MRQSLVDLDFLDMYNHNDINDCVTLNMQQQEPIAIHVWYIYIGKYTSPMDPMGNC